MPKPHRVLLDRVSDYADEAAGFFRRRRTERHPFARVTFADGRGTEAAPESPEGKALFAAANTLIELVESPA